MLLITTFVELRMAAGRSRTWEGRPHAVSGRRMLIHTCHVIPIHTVLCRGLEKPLSEWHVHSMAQVQHGICESDTTALCKFNGKDTI
jgi:hypothetical protein